MSFQLMQKYANGQTCSNKVPTNSSICLWWSVGIWYGEVGVSDSFDVFNLAKYNIFVNVLIGFTKIGS
jgi:hypothetical protein